MVLTSRILRRLSVLFLALSVALWVAKLTLRDEELEDECRSNGSLQLTEKMLSGRNMPRGVDPMGKGR